MNGQPGHGLLVDHGALDLIAADLRTAIGAIDARLDRLEAELGPLRSEWGGQAREAYDVSKRTWDRAIHEMTAVLTSTATAVAQSNAGYARTDRSAASTFEQA